MNPDEPLRTKNLAEEDPASMEDTLGGYVWVPRMIDKARASAAGTLGSYYRYPCPIDTDCLRRLGLSPDGFARLALAATTGQEVLAGLRQAGAASPDESYFDPVQMNVHLHRSKS